MSTESDDLLVPQEGHVLLLLEDSPGLRTFSDYPDIGHCLNTMVTMYEEYRDAFKEDNGGELKDFLNWIDSMHKLECFQYDRQVNRFRRIPRSDLKLQFEAKGNETGSEPEKKPDSLEDADDEVEEDEENQLDYDDDEEAWDR